MPQEVFELRIRARGEIEERNADDTRDQAHQWTCQGHQAVPNGRKRDQGEQVSPCFGHMHLQFSNGYHHSINVFIRSVIHLWAHFGCSRAAPAEHAEFMEKKIRAPGGLRGQALEMVPS